MATSRGADWCKAASSSCYVVGAYTNRITCVRHRRFVSACSEANCCRECDFLCHPRAYLLLKTPNYGAMRDYNTKPERVLCFRLSTMVAHGLHIKKKKKVPLTTAITAARLKVTPHQDEPGRYLSGIHECDFFGHPWGSSRGHRSIGLHSGRDDGSWVTAIKMSPGSSSVRPRSYPLSITPLGSTLPVRSSSLDRGRGHHENVRLAAFYRCHGRGRPWHADLGAGTEVHLVRDGESASLLGWNRRRSWCHRRRWRALVDAGDLSGRRRGWGGNGWPSGRYLGDVQATSVVARFESGAER